MTASDFSAEVKKHHTLILVTLGIVAVWFIVAKLTSHFDQTAHDQVVLAEDKLKQDKLAQKAADDQAAKDSAAYQSLKEQLTAQNAQLNAKLATLAVSLANQQTKDKNLPLPELGARIQSQITAGTVSALPDGIKLDDPAARSAVVLLDELPADRQQIKTQIDLLGNQSKLLGALETRAVSAENAENACKKTQEQAETTCNARIKEVKDKALHRNLIVAAIFGLAGIIAGHKF